MPITNNKQPETPCVVCEKSFFYCVFTNQETGEKIMHTDMINNGTTFTVLGNYGSNWDGCKYEAIICDDCLDKWIQRNKVLAHIHTEGDQ